MIWRVIFCWLLATTFAHANLPRHSAFPNFPRVNQYQVGGISLPNAASIANSYDGLGRLTSTALVDHWGHVLDGYGYTLDTMGLRTNIIRQLGLSTNNIAIAYDPISQITNWSGTETNGTLRQNEQLSYAYDAAGNLLVRTNNALVQTFTVDSLNQLSNVTRTGTLTVSGSLPEPPGSVTVNGTNAQTNSDFTFAASGNTLISGANTFTIVADDHYGSNITTSVVSVNLPATVNIQYDANGNLISDGTRTFQYDAENQLTNVYATNAWRVGFVYDGLKRKRVEIDSTWSSGWVPTNGTEFIYDGNLVIQERTTNNVVSVTYTRGLDMGGSLQGAGGIGGLLARTDGNGSTFYHADGSGNITALMDANQRVTARYEYDPYGRMLGMWGTNAPVNRYRFSSKEFISAAQLYAYGRRFYEPNFSRWLNPDPIQERGGINLYGFNRNNPVNRVDPYGLEPSVSDLAGIGEMMIAAFNGAVQAVDSVSEATGLTGALGLSPSQMLEAAGPEFNDLNAAEREAKAAENLANDAKAAAQEIPKPPSSCPPPKPPLPVNAQTIKDALKDSNMKTPQNGVSIPVVERYVRQLEAGGQPPPISVANDVIIDGNHRYVAGQVFGQDPPQVPGTLSQSQVDLIQAMQDLFLDPEDWGNE